MKLKLLIGCGLLILLLLFSLVSIYPDWLWFKNLSFSPVFLTMLFTKFGFGLVVWVFLILIIAVNLYIARRLSPGAGPGVSLKIEGGYGPQLGLSGNTLNLLFVVLSWLQVFLLHQRAPISGTWFSAICTRNPLASQTLSLIKTWVSMCLPFLFTILFGAVC